MERYLWSGASSSRLYGHRLNRRSGVRPVSLANKGNRQITERGRPYPGKRSGFARIQSPGLLPHTSLVGSQELGRANLWACPTACYASHETRGTSGQQLGGEPLGFAARSNAHL